MHDQPGDNKRSRSGYFLGQANQKIRAPSKKTNTTSRIACRCGNCTEESKENSKARCRGESELKHPNQSNYIFILGSAPKFGVKVDTKLIRDVMDCFTQQYNKLSQTVMFPNVIKQLRGTDTNIEYVTTLTLQKIRMAVKNFPSRRKSAYIFVQTDLKIQREEMRLGRIKYWQEKLAAKEITESMMRNVFEQFKPTIDYTNAMPRASAA